ncbi:MAG: CHAT domain-containing protein [Candidatus Aminicenantes bacterium]|nr:MAG: CHAT domain-containing protein [Candidatus Aminicenantes bacterium]
MRIRFFLLFMVLFLLLPFCLYPENTTNDRWNDHNEKLKNQQILMGFVLSFCDPKSPGFITALCKEALFQIHEIYKQENNRMQTLSFYSSLLDSGKYKKLYPYVFYYLGDFYGKQSKEKYLLKSLRYSLTNQDRQFALTRLYRFYKQERIHYLELSYLLKLIEIQKINRDFAELEISYQDLGEIYENKRDYLAALDYYFEALVYSQKEKKNRSGYIYLNIANVFSTLNRKELAKKYIKKALDYTVKYKKEDLEVMVLSAYSKLYYEEHDYANALKFINLSLKTENQKNKYICAIPSLYQKALILLKMQEIGKGVKNTHQAMTLLKAAVEKGLKKKKYNGLLPIMSEYIEKLIAFERFSEAKNYLNHIDDIYAPYYPYYFFYYYLEGLFYEKQGQMGNALQFFRKTMQNLEEYFSGPHYQQYHSLKQKTQEIYSRAIEFYLEMYNRTENQEYIKKALYFSEIKNSYIYESVTLKNKTYTHLMEEKEKLEQEFLFYNQKYLQLLKNGELNSQDYQQLRLYENKLESLKTQHAELKEFILESPITYKKYNFKDFNLPLIRRRLNPRQLIVKYAVLKENIYAFCIGRRSVGYWKLTGSTREILTQVKQLTSPLDDFTEGNVDYLRINYDLQLAHRLYKILVKDTWEFQETVDEIFIIPDEELFKLPFEALVTGFNQHKLEPDMVFSEYSSANYLIEKLPVSYSLSLFHFRGKWKPLKQKKYTITAFASPIIRDQAVDSDHFHVNMKKNTLEHNPDTALFHEIPSSGKEILRILPIFSKKKSRAFLGEEFNRNNFETYAPQSKILHIATHFINNVHYPQYSALLFSPHEDSSPYYYAHEIFKLKLDTQLVVLSACESSEKHLLGLQGLRGMTASFRHSGVRSMIVSMWPVDEHSSELTPLFYQEYKNNLHKPRYSTISTALRAAKLKLMKKTAALENGLKISFSHPFVWANYILYNFK